MSLLRQVPAGNAKNQKTGNGAGLPQPGTKLKGPGAGAKLKLGNPTPATAGSKSSAAKGTGKTTAKKRPATGDEEEVITRKKVKKEEVQDFIDLAVSDNDEDDGDQSGNYNPKEDPDTAAEDNGVEDAVKEASTSQKGKGKKTGKMSPADISRFIAWLNLDTAAMPVSTIGNNKGTHIDKVMTALQTNVLIHCLDELAMHRALLVCLIHKIQGPEELSVDISDEQFQAVMKQACDRDLEPLAAKLGMTGFKAD